MKLHYFEQETADRDDTLLQLCIKQGYVPNTCLLGGMVIWDEVNKGKNVCAGCEAPRDKCHGQLRKIKEVNNEV